MWVVQVVAPHAALAAASASSEAPILLMKVCRPNFTIESERTAKRSDRVIRLGGSWPIGSKSPPV